METRDICAKYKYVSPEYISKGSLADRSSAFALLLSLFPFAAGLRAQGSIAGEVTGADGRPVAGASVQATRQGAKSAPMKMQADRRGRFAFQNMPEGVYEIDAAGTAGLASPRQVVKVTQAAIQTSLRVAPVGTAAAPAKKKKKRVWVPPQAGSMLGGGYVEVDDDTPDSADSKRTRTEIRHDADVRYRVSHQGAIGPSNISGQAPERLKACLSFLINAAKKSLQRFIWFLYCALSASVA